jgi:CHASE2 domain-containing sensor protein
VLKKNIYLSLNVIISLIVVAILGIYNSTYGKPRMWQVMLVIFIIGLVVIITTIVSHTFLLANIYQITIMIILIGLFISACILFNGLVKWMSIVVSILGILDSILYLYQFLKKEDK